MNGIKLFMFKYPHALEIDIDIHLIFHIHTKSLAWHHGATKRPGLFRKEGKKEGRKLQRHTCFAGDPQLGPVYVLYWHVMPHLACLVVEPDERMVPGEHLAVEGGVVLSRTAACDRAPDLHRFVQVDVTLLKRVWVRAAGKHGQSRRHWWRLQCVTPTRGERQGFLIQIDTPSDCPVLLLKI